MATVCVAAQCRRGVAPRDERGAIAFRGNLSDHFEAVFVFWMAHDVHGDVPDERHVVRPIFGPQADEIIVEDDVEHPVELVLDAPMGTDGVREGFGAELGRGQIIAAFLLYFPMTLDDGLDHADHCKVRKTRLILVPSSENNPTSQQTLCRRTSIRPWPPSGLVTGRSFPLAGRRASACDGPVGFQGEKVIAAARDNLIGPVSPWRRL